MQGPCCVWAWVGTGRGKIGCLQVRADQNTSKRQSEITEFFAYSREGYLEKACLHVRGPDNVQYDMTEQKSTTHVTAFTGQRFCHCHSKHVMHAVYAHRVYRLGDAPPYASHPLCNALYQTLTCFENLKDRQMD